MALSNDSSHHLGPPLANVSLFVLRIGIGLILFILHGLSEATAAWKFIWGKESWQLFDQLTEMALPFPAIIATTTAIILTVFPASIFAGFLSRISSAALIVFLLVVLVGAPPVENLISEETILLYIIALLAILLSGSGSFSIDAIFSRNRQH